LFALNLRPEQTVGATFSRGRGCPYCANTGYRGRFGIFEIFLVNEDIQRLIYESATSHGLRNRARELGMRSMREDGIRKVLTGMTTVEELVTITVADVS
jgi:general secretion pathway protein E/type IV pilus assembly protein PilB